MNSEPGEQNNQEEVLNRLSQDANRVVGIINWIALTPYDLQDRVTTYEEGYWEKKIDLDAVLKEIKKAGILEQVPYREHLLDRKKMLEELEAEYNYTQMGRIPAMQYLREMRSIDDQLATGKRHITPSTPISSGAPQADDWTQPQYLRIAEPVAKKMFMDYVVRPHFKT